MSLSLIFSTILLTFFLYYLRKFLQFRTTVNQFAGPPVDNFMLGHLGLFLKPSNLTNYEFSPKFYQKLYDIYSQYTKDGVFRLWMGPAYPVYILSNVGSVETLLTSQVNVNKGSEYNFMNSFLKNGLFLAKGQEWRHRRKMLLPAYNIKALKEFISIFAKHTDKLIDTIEENLTPRSKVIGDVLPIFDNRMIHIVMETSLGSSDDTVDAEEKQRYGDALKEGMHTAINRLRNPLHWADSVFGLTAKGRGFFKDVDFMKEYAYKIIEQRIADYQKNLLKNEKPDQSRASTLIDILMSRYLAQQTNDSHPVNAQIIQHELNTFMFGGHDTTALTATFTLMWVGYLPEVQAKVHQELEEVFEGDMTRPITMDHLRELRYLEACIKETLRFYPPAQAAGRYLTEPMTLPNGQTLPAKSTVYVPIVLLHRDPQYFAQPDKYIPERYLDAASRISPYAYIPFSAGPRLCIGLRYAMVELKFVLASLFRRYKVKSFTNPSDVVLDVSGIIKPITKIAIAFEKYKCK